MFMTSHIGRTNYEWKRKGGDGKHSASSRILRVNLLPFKHLEVVITFHLRGVQYLQQIFAERHKATV